MNDALPLRVRLRAAVLAVVVPPLLYVMSFARLASWLGGPPSAAWTPSTADSFNDVSLAIWVDRLMRRMPGVWRYTCLKRSAVLYSVLRKNGRSVELWIGVRHDHAQERGIGAHAWLVRDGVPYLEPAFSQASQHTPIARFPEHRGS